PALKLLPILLATHCSPTHPPFPYTTLFRSDPSEREPRVSRIAPRRSAMEQQGSRNQMGTFHLETGAESEGDLDGGHHHFKKRWGDRKSTRLNSSHQIISYAVFCLKKKKQEQ